MTGDTDRVAPGPHYLRRGGRSFVPVGAHYVPTQGPDWPWRVGPEEFDRAFAGMAEAGLDTVRIDLLWAALEPERGQMDEAHMRVLDEVLEAARRHGLLLHPTFFIGGEVGDAYWDVPWRGDGHPHRDPDLIRLQAEHVAALARRWRGDPAIVAWDLTDEPPLWIFQDTTDDEAREWTRALVGALREADPDHLVTIGTSGQEIGHGPFRADVVADFLDLACVHPYPIYQEELYPDALLSPRMTHAAAFETALAAGAGRPVMVHEYGASSTQFDPEAIASYDRLLTWSSFGRGAIGFYAWCWTDAEPAAYRRAPYVRQPHETQFGVTDHQGMLRPRGRVLAEAAARIGELDLDALASNGPVHPPAAIVVPHEFAHPYDRGAYGMADAPAGPYVPAETVWNPSRDPRPLVRGWLNAFVLAARADISASFPRERVDGTWPEARVVLLPAPLSSTTSSLLHVRTSWWGGAQEYLEGGGVIYLSCSAETAIPEMEGFSGCRIADRAPAGDGPALRFVAPWGPFAAGDVLSLPGWDGGLHTRGVRLRVADAETIAVDAEGAPALVVARRGAGATVTCAFPIELLLATVPDAHGPADRSWGIYDGLAKLAGIRQVTSHPEVTAGELHGPSGTLTALTNHGPAPLSVTATLPDGARVPVEIEAFGFALLERREGT
jgi:endo-1,4-beta-mannosidase